MDITDSILIIVPIAVAIDFVFGDPEYRLHPIRIIGNMIIAPVEEFLFKKKLNNHLGGLLLLVLTLMFTVAPVIALNYLLKDIWPLYFIFNIFIIYSCLSLKDLKDHALRVLDRLEADDIQGARIKLSYIVGRQTHDLDEEATARACVETVAENFSDGFVAPLFFAFIGGAPLALLYKAANTLDSSVGYKNSKYIKFGYFPAKFDDLMNWLPARISLLLIMAANSSQAGKGKTAWKKAFSQRLKHTSPNAGHPEAAMAAVLDVKLGGPGYYGSKLIEKDYINETGRPVKKTDIAKAIAVVYCAGFLGAGTFLWARYLVMLVL